MFKTIKEVDVITNRLILAVEAFTTAEASRLKERGYLEFQLQDYCREHGVKGDGPIPRIATAKMTAVGRRVERAWPLLIIYRDQEGEGQRHRQRRV